MIYFHTKASLLMCMPTCGTPVGGCGRCKSPGPRRTCQGRAHLSVSSWVMGAGKEKSRWQVHIPHGTRTRAGCGRQPTARGLALAPTSQVHRQARHLCYLGLPGKAGLPLRRGCERLCNEVRQAMSPGALNLSPGFSETALCV